MNRHRKDLLLTAGVLLATSCVDDPVAIDEQPIENADGLPAYQVHQDDDGETKDPFRARLKIDLEVEGELSPNTPITVKLEAEATEAITGGDVKVALPTFAAMKLAGPGKRLEYEPDGKAPVVVRWRLPAMEEGDHWKQLVEIGSVVEKGYYQIAVITDTEGPGDSPYVRNNTFNEAWLFVVDGGGKMTRVFDASLFPERIIPQPGPFERWLEYHSSGDEAQGNAAGAAAASASFPVALYFFAEDQWGTNKAMRGAKITAEYKTNGSKTITRVRTVPSNGYVEFPCPPSGQRIIGKAENPTTLEVEGGQHLAHWQADDSDCNGRTAHIRGSREQFFPWRHLNDAIETIDDQFDYSRARIRYKVKRGDGASYSRFTDKITFGDNTVDDLWVAGHEYTHALHHKSLGGLWYVFPFNCRGHELEEPSGYKCALKEGLADYGGSLAEPGRYALENRRISPPSGRGAGEIEANVAAMFWDLIDENNESNDEVSLDAEDVMTVFKTCYASGSRDDTADFVWCMENRVNSTVHKKHFPGLGVPSSASSTRPSDWDADDIRSTWIKSVGK
jgi:predicted RNA-binding Zn-ribbon protein involved in translation (DUF1610 family)